MWNYVDNISLLSFILITRMNIIAIGIEIVCAISIGSGGDCRAVVIREIEHLIAGEFVELEEIEFIWVEQIVIENWRARFWRCGQETLESIETIICIVDIEHMRHELIVVSVFENELIQV